MPNPPWKFRTPLSPGDAAVQRAKTLPAFNDEAVIPKKTKCSFKGKGMKTRCGKPTLIGSPRCLKHQKPETREQLQARLVAMGVPAVERLEMLAHQNENLAVSMTAVNQILTRVIGASTEASEREKRPQIRIAIAVGGIPLPQQPTVLTLPAAAEEDEEERD